jgi:MFS family permease
MFYDSWILKKHPLFRNFLTASTISLIGSNIFDIAVPLYVYAKTQSAIYLSLAAVALNLPYFLMAPLTGFLVDNYDKRRVMLFSDIGQVVCVAAFLFYDILGFSAVWPILLLVFTAKTFMNTFETVATFQLIPVTVSKEDLPRANAWFLASQRFISVAGPFLGGIILTTFGMRMSSIVNILTFSATLYFTYHMKNLNTLIEGHEHTSSASFTVKNIFSEFISSLKYIWSSPIFKGLVFLMFLWNFSAMTPNTPTLTYYFTVSKDLSARDYGFFLSIIGIGGVIGFLISSFFYRKFTFAQTLTASALWQMVCASLCIFLFPFPLAFAGVFALSRLGSSTLSMGTFVLRQTLIPREKMGCINASGAR